MKSFVLCVMLAAGVFFAGVASASPELAQANCGKCHEMDKKKKGPSWKAIAAKYKGKADAEAAAFKVTTDTSGDHPEFKAKTEDIKTVIKWALAQ